MPSLFRLATAQTASLILSANMAYVSLSQVASAGSSQHLNVPISGSKESICYIQAADGTTRDLSNICGKVTQPTTQPAILVNQNCNSRGECFPTCYITCHFPPSIVNRDSDQLDHDLDRGTNQEKKD